MAVANIDVKSGVAIVEGCSSDKSARAKLYRLRNEMGLSKGLYEFCLNDKFSLQEKSGLFVYDIYHVFSGWLGVGFEKPERHYEEAVNALA